MEKLNILNTINGSGLALSRTLLALVENFQQKDGSITIPDALRDYFKADSINKNKLKIISRTSLELLRSSAVKLRIINLFIIF